MLKDVTGKEYSFWKGKKAYLCQVLGFLVPGLSIGLEEIDELSKEKKRL